MPFASRAVTPRDITRLIDRHFDALSPELQRAARWARQHPTELGLQSMRASAKRAGVAPATMTRLAQTLGFDGFDVALGESMSLTFRRWVSGAAMAAHLAALPDEANAGDVYCRSRPDRVGFLPRRC